MITKIIIDKTATYNEQTEIESTEVNYIFGSNGSGKTVISKIIGNIQSYSNCSLNWDTPDLQTLVYNRDFVKENFSQSSSIKGIFTLGKGSKEALDFIQNTKVQINELENQLAGLNRTLDTKRQEETDENNNAAEKAWRIKLKYEPYFRQAYTGFIRSYYDFLQKCINEKSNSSKLLSYDEIKSQCEMIFNKELKKYEIFESIHYLELLSKEKSQILNTKIIGKEDVEIGKLIKKLNNSDWIKEGLDYLSETKNVCPFCQQNLNDKLKIEIENYFDETYTNQCLELQNFKISYEEYITKKIADVEEITNNNIEILDFQELVTQIQLLKEIYKNNLVLIENKIKTPSIVINLESVSKNFETISKLIEKYRSLIKTNNDTLDNISTERIVLKSEVWRFLVNELEYEITLHQKNIDGIQKGIQNLERTILIKEDEKKQLEALVKIKESEVTSIEHTINEINKLLTLWSFNNFRLAEAQKGYYKIVREDGTDVKETLSEGEYNFITFLYFYNLIKGSIENTGITRDKVVVFDDPISSLDCNILFVVSNLIKEIVLDCLKESSAVKQIFILTHNVYFYKEVTFKGARDNPSKKESFWILRKINDSSKIFKTDKSPINTTYELLWREIQDIENLNPATIHNTLRRILEYYFNIIGGLKYEECINKFEGEDKIICKTLVSWINDGSHFINEDLFISDDISNIAKYQKVFKEIFHKMGHESHYKMMMKECENG